MLISYFLFTLLSLFFYKFTYSIILQLLFILQNIINFFSKPFFYIKCMESQRQHWIKKNIAEVLLLGAEKGRQLWNFIPLSSKSLVYKSNINFLFLLAPFDHNEAKKDFDSYYCKLFKRSFHKKEKLFYPSTLAPQFFLNLYTSQQKKIYLIINQALKLDPDPANIAYSRLFIQEIFMHIKSTYKSRQKIKGTKIFYRGGTISSEELKQLKNIKKKMGKVYVQNKSFFSTSLSFKIASKFYYNYIFEIHVSDKKREEWSDFGFCCIENQSQYNERQVIFNALNTFQVLDFNLIQYQGETYNRIILKYGILSEFISKKQNNQQLSPQKKTIIQQYQYIWKRMANISCQGDIFQEIGDKQSMLKYYHEKKKKKLAEKKIIHNKEAINFCQKPLQTSKEKWLIQTFKSFIQICKRKFFKNENYFCFRQKTLRIKSQGQEFFLTGMLNKKYSFSFSYSTKNIFSLRLQSIKGINSQTEEFMVINILREQNWKTKSQNLKLIYKKSNDGRFLEAIDLRIIIPNEAVNYEAFVRKEKQELKNLLYKHSQVNAPFLDETHNFLSFSSQNPQQILSLMPKQSIAHTRQEDE